MDTLRSVVYRAKGWGCDCWAEAFAESQLAKLEIDISNQPFECLRHIIRNPPGTGCPLQELAIHFSSRARNFSNVQYEPLVALIRQLDPTEHFKMNFTNHFTMFPYLFQSLATQPLQPFQYTLRTLEFGAMCPDAWISNEVVEAFPNLTEIRGVSFDHDFLPHLAYWMQEIRTEKANSVPSSENILITCLAAHVDDETYNRAMQYYHNIKSNYNHDKIWLSMTTPLVNTDPLATILLCQRNLIQSPRSITIIVPQSSAKEKDYLESTC
jgi:hypothetical protein